jgi:DedD protein
MEVRVRERLIGALVLVAIIVLVVPAILKGRQATETAEPEAPSQQSRSLIIDVEPKKAAPQDEMLVPEQELPREPAREKFPERDTATAAPEKPVKSPVAAPAAPPPRSSARPVASIETPAWAVQLGAFSHRDRADELVTELRRRGYSAFVLEYRATGKVLYRVRVGPEQDRARAEEIATRLGKDGFQPVVARHP